MWLFSLGEIEDKKLCCREHSSPSRRYMDLQDAILITIHHKHATITSSNLGIKRCSMHENRLSTMPSFWPEQNTWGKQIQLKLVVCMVPQASSTAKYVIKMLKSAAFPQTNGDSYSIFTLQNNSFFQSENPNYICDWAGIPSAWELQACSAFTAGSHLQLIICAAFV